MNEESRETVRRKRDTEDRGGIHGTRFMVETNKAGGSNTARTQKFSCSYVRE